MFKEYGPLSTMMYQKTKAVGQSLVILTIITIFYKM